jgi:hypothetical protein
MRWETMAIGFLAGVVALGCGVPNEPVRPQDEGAQVKAGDESVILERPFTAEQIREEWIQGFQLRVRRWTPVEEVIENWTVVYADGDGADIQAFNLNEAGEHVGEPRVESTSWIELRDHASFPADRATREEATRETALGELQGWLYTVEDTEAGTISEFFFAETCPGAPVVFRVFKDGQVVSEFEQLERHRPVVNPG